MEVCDVFKRTLVYKLYFDGPLLDTFRPAVRAPSNIGVFREPTVRATDTHNGRQRTAICALQTHDKISMPIVYQITIVYFS